VEASSTSLSTTASIWHESGRDVHAFAGPEAALLERGAGSGAEDQLAPEDVHRLVLAVVVLQAEHVAGAHVKDLADVAVGAGPDELIAPRLLDSVGDVGHWISEGMREVR
jgi:hypothetical protein